MSTKIPTPNAPEAPASPFGHASTPPTGTYLVPAHHGHHHPPVERGWDGDVWTDAVTPAPEGATIPRHHRRPFAFLRTPGWLLLVVLVASSLIAMALVHRDSHAQRPEGIQWLLPLFGFISAASVMAAVAIYVQRRIRVDQLADVGKMLGWGVLSGLVAVGFALLWEAGLPRALGITVDAANEARWAGVAGPAEEAGKLIVPVILWFTGRFRLPRQGYFLAICSAASFGMLEAARYGFSPDLYTWSRNWGEILHVLLTGFIAAVAWRAAWKGRSWFTGPAILAWVVAVVLHSVNDMLVIGTGHGVSRDLGMITAVVMVVLYFLQKHFARQLVPPDNVAAVSEGWRPVAPMSK